MLPTKVSVREVEDLRITDIHCYGCNTDLHITNKDTTYMSCRCGPHLNIAYYEVRKEKDAEGKTVNILHYNKYHPMYNSQKND